MELRLLRYFVAVAEEHHMGRAAARLQMTQPPLSRAIRQLEASLGVTLLSREPHGVELTRAGTALYREARSLLDRADRLSSAVAAAEGGPMITVGTCADTADQLGSRLVTEFRRQCPEVGLSLYETDLTDPTAGLRTDVVDVALTRAPFDETGLAVQVLRDDPVGVVLVADDPLAQQESVLISELQGRRWVRLPEGTDPVWSAYWAAAGPSDQTVIVRTIQESLQSVLWSNAATFAPLRQGLPDGLVNVPVTDKEPSRVVVAARRSTVDANLNAQLFVAIAVASARHAGSAS